MRQGSRMRLSQAGVLAGIGLAFVGSPPQAAPPPDCKTEGICSFLKPRLLFVLDYGTAMNAAFDGQQTRWEAATKGVHELVDADNGFLVTNFMLGLLRFGHDPDGNTPGTKIPNDSSGLSDGVRLDVPMYDANAPGKPYFGCTQGDAIHELLDNLAPPLNGVQNGIGSWTRGGLELVAATMQQAAADHPQDQDKRLGMAIVVTQGVWTSRNGAVKLLPTQDNPAIAADALFNNGDIPTHVITVGDAVGEPHADELAVAGGTIAAISVAEPGLLLTDLGLVIDELVATGVQSGCEAKRVRLMLLVDGSSTIVNTLDGIIKRAPPGVGGWDIARAALTGDQSLLHVDWSLSGEPLENQMFVGLSVYGGNMPNEADVLVQYGECLADNRAWALDPSNSCAAPGCLDPYADAPITWMSKDGSQVDPPGFDVPTLSHMPLCDQGVAPDKGCFGSAAFLHLGLELTQQNLAAYKAACPSDFEGACDEDTVFRNLLVTEGLYDSTDVQVQAPLAAMFAAGVTTYVLAVGEFSESPEAQINLAKLADWGSGGQHPPFTLATRAELEALLDADVTTPSDNPCCAFVLCDDGRPRPPEPDPVPEPDVLESSSGAEDSTTGGDSTTSAPPQTTDVTTTTTDVTTSDPESTSGSTTAVTSEDSSVPTDGGVEVTGAGDPRPGGDESSTGASVDEATPDCGCTSTDLGAGAPGLLMLAALRRRRRSS